MRTNINVFLPAMGFCGRLPALDSGGQIPSRERLGHKNEASAGDEVREPDAYKVAVLLMVGAAILSLF
jgi:hypothetical protein